MELWFLYALVSMVFAGLHTFLSRVAAHRNHNSALNTFWIAMVAAACAALVLTVMGDIATAFDFGAYTHVVWATALGTGLVYSASATLRIESLRFIDSMLFFPVYKTVGPFAVAIAGVVIFHEHLSHVEIVGIVLGLLVPLLMVHKSEQMRQRALAFGLLLAFLSAMFSMLSAILSKWGADTGANMMAFLIIADLASAFGALGLYHVREYHTNGWALNGYLHRDTLVLAITTGVLSFVSYYLFLLAISLGKLSVVFTVGSFYILIPIVLSIWWYGEHVNARKVLAIALSLAALMFLG